VTSAHRPLINVLISHANPLIASGLAAALRDQDDFTARVLDPDGPLAPADLREIDVLVADYPFAMTIAGAQHAAIEGPPARAPRIMVLSSNDGEWRVRSALDAGVLGYVVTSRPLHEIVEGVRALHRGRRYLCPCTAARMADSYMSQALTRREAEVLKALGAGVSNKTIARQLGMEVGTVKSHLRSMMSKLNAHNRTEIVAIALTRGLTPRHAAHADDERRTAPMPPALAKRMGHVAEMNA